MSTPTARATIEDVARLAGVSAKTVSRVFADSSQVAPETKERVLSAASRLRFRPNALARNLRRGGVTSTVAFIIGDMQNPFYFAVAAGIEQELAQHGYTMLLATTDDSPATERRVIDVLLAQRVRALLLIPVADDQSYLDGERQLGTPVIGVDRPLGDLVADTVVLSNRTGMAEAVRSLVARGHRRIAFVANPAAVYTVQERLAGYRQALAEVGVTDTARWERLSDDPTSITRDVVRGLLGAAEPPTAIVTGNNRATAAVLRALRDTGASTAVIGFDDFELAEMLGVSVVSYDASALGRAAARLAIDRIAEPSGRAREIEIPTHLVHRGSGERPPS
ncbi:LacI family DNA-binding transcriptional regulator [Microbacterium sp. RD1]|uniref:LacI family DNA-binding transcriptional regulator n=1 Tax=Microbacterium sp. RD1 TaxID=3457313 RepID=UPI003FA58927